MAFRGWPAEALEFYEGLEADNSKGYWTEHKAVYEATVKAPMDALLEELSATFGAPKLFRPYRDVRFSKDKTPYKTHIAGYCERGPYLQLSKDGLACGAGYYRMARDQLDRYRRAVAAAPGEELVAVQQEAAKKGIEVSGHDMLRSAPRGYPKDHPRIELLRAKGLVAWRAFPVAPWLGTAKAKDRILEFHRDTEPLVAWLDAHVGPSTEPEA